MADVMEQTSMHDLLEVLDDVLGRLNTEHPDECCFDTGIADLRLEVGFLLQRKVAEEERTLLPLPVFCRVETEFGSLQDFIFGNELAERGDGVG